MRGTALIVGFIVAAAAAGCSSSTGPSGNGGSGGHSDTITASATTVGGNYGSGGNFFFSPNPDSTTVGSTVTFNVGSVAHNIHFISGPTTPDSVEFGSNTSSPRTFATAGTYTFKCTVHNFSGTLVVH